MSVSLSRNFEETVTFSLDQVLSPGDTTIDVPMVRSDWESGLLILWDFNTRESYKRTMHVVVTTDADHAFSQSTRDYGTVMPAGYLAYTIHNWYYAGFSYSQIVGIGGFLSYNDYGYRGWRIRLTKAWIEGTNLKLTFTNTHSSGTDTLKFKGEVRLSRNVLKQTDFTVTTTTV